MFFNRVSILTALICTAAVVVSSQTSHRNSALSKSGRSAALSNTALHTLARNITVQIEAAGMTTPLGSGFWLDDENHVVTCWHVTQAANGHQLSVALGADNVYQFGTSIYSDLHLIENASVIAENPVADLAILKVEGDLLHNQMTLIRTRTQSIKVHPEAAKLSEDFPPLNGALVTLAGYPLGRGDLFTQNGNVSGTSVIPPPWAKNPKGPETIRVLLSLVSNPGNSGGPVLDDKGKVIGVLEGNLTSPVKNEKGEPTMYVRPVTVNGQQQMNSSGQPQYEIAPLQVNSGLSIVIPARLIGMRMKASLRDPK